LLPLPKNPKTNINTNGNAMLKITAEGLLKTAFKLPLVIAIMALS